MSEKLGMWDLDFLVLPTYIKPTNLAIGTVSKLIFNK